MIYKEHWNTKWNKRITNMTQEQKYIETDTSLIKAF